MTEVNQKKTEYLKKFQDNVKSAKRIEEQIMKLRSDTLYPSFILSDTPRSTQKKDLSDYAAKLDGLINELKSVRFKRIKTYLNISRLVEAMEDETERQVLIFKYIDGLNWEDVCDKIGYSWKHTHRIHTKALDHFPVPQDDIE